MKGERIKVKNIEELKEKLKSEKKDNILVKLIFLNLMGDKLTMHFPKPYPMNYRKPKDAEKLLVNQLQLTFSLLKEKGFKEEEIGIGFIDERSPQNTAL